MSILRDLFNRVDDARKTGRTLTVFVVTLITLQVIDANLEQVDLGSSHELYAGLLTPAVEYAWRKLRTRFGLDR
jgi:hypothetical protein